MTDDIKREELALPLTIEESGDGDLYVVNADEDTLATVLCTRREMHAIVTAANAHHELVEAAAEVLAAFDAHKSMTPAERIVAGISDRDLQVRGLAAMDALRAALASAEGGGS